jgi:hypothetical protein
VRRAAGRRPPSRSATALSTRSQPRAVTVRYRDGIEIELSDGTTVVCDAVDPDRVYTQHGSAAALADHLTAAGYDATALRQNQTSLGDF